MNRKRCANCEKILEGNFCSNCGQSASEHRINAHYFIHDIPHSVFHIDKGFFYTLKGLFVNAGVVIEDYLNGKRVKHFRPFAYVMIMTAISALIVKLLVWVKEKLVHFYQPDFVVPEKHNFFENYFSIFIFLMIPFCSLVTKFFFYNKKYNFWEHFLANTYINAQINFIWILMHLLSTVIILFTQEYFEFQFSTFQIFFMILFLYLYGRAFGHLMHPFYKTWKLILILTLMNTVLYMTYAIGFYLAGFMKLPFSF